MGNKGRDQKGRLREQEKAGRETGHGSISKKIVGFLRINVTRIKSW